SFCRGTHARHFVAEHRQSRARVRVDGHRRFRQSDAFQTSRLVHFGLPDGNGDCDVHDCGPDFFAGVVEFAWPVASVNKTTQRRQLVVDTGSGGTEVKPQVSEKHKENSQEVNINVKPNFQRLEKQQILFSITITQGAKYLVKTPSKFAIP